jgi:hypothetical protein
VSSHFSFGHPLPFVPFAGVIPSGQQLNLVSLQDSNISQPSENGPVAAVLLSEQHPYFDVRHAAGFLDFGLHLRFGAMKIVVYSVVSSSSVVLQISTSPSVVSAVSSSDDSVVSVSSVDGSSVADVSSSLADSVDSGDSVDSPASVALEGSVASDASVALDGSVASDAGSSEAFGSSVTSSDDFEDSSDVPEISVLRV